MIKRSYYLVIFFVTVALYSCQNPAQTNESESVTGRDANLTALRQNFSSNAAGTPKSDFTESPLNKIPVSRDELSDMRTVVQVYDNSNIGSLTVPGFGSLHLGKDEKSLSVYYIETKAVVNQGDTSVYGVGYSIHYLFKRIKKGISLDKLPYIAASVQLDGNKTQVFYSIQSYGMQGSPLVKFFKPIINKPFDVEGFGIMQSSIDGIHNVLSDTELSKAIKFTPHVFKNIKPSEL